MLKKLWTEACALWRALEMSPDEIAEAEYTNGFQWAARQLAAGVPRDVIAARIGDGSLGEGAAGNFDRGVHEALDTFRAPRSAA